MEELIEADFTPQFYQREKSSNRVARLSLAIFVHRGLNLKELKSRINRYNVVTLRDQATPGLPEAPSRICF
jgi:hypothetical protein